METDDSFLFGFEMALKRKPVLVASLLLFLFWRSNSSPAEHKIVLRLVPQLIATPVEHGGAKNTTSRPNAACNRRVTASLGKAGGVNKFFGPHNQNF